MVKLETDGKRRMLEQYDDKKRVYQSFLNEIEHQITSILQTSQVTCNAITSRLKTRESLAEKIERKQGKYTDLSGVTDIAGVRIITYYSADVDKIADIIESEFDVDHENSIDKRESLEPDRFGYCSVHYVVGMNAERLALRECRAYEGMKCEIQIRSVLQHAWAEIEHDIGYKSEIAIPKEMRRSFSRIAGLLEIADKEFNDIRDQLVSYGVSANTIIRQDEYSDKEIDALLLDAIINTDNNIQRLAQHITTLMDKPLKDKATKSYVECMISKLNWLGVRTVKQINLIINQYTDTAMTIASQKLKDYQRKEDEDETDPAIALFYLAYAVLLSEKCNKNDIQLYLEENHIGRSTRINELVDQLYALGKMINND